MEETEKKNAKWQFVIPIILTIIIVGVFVYLDYKKRSEQKNKQGEGQISIYKPRPVSPDENLRRAEVLTPDQLTNYGCAGPNHLEAETLKQPDSIWEIKKDSSSTKISLGKYRINAPANTIFDIMKLWLYFFSDKLSTREDKIYALENSYVSRISLVVNSYEKEIKLGGDEYMLIELDYPLGDLYPYDREAVLEYEIIIELKCKNIQNGTCLNNEGKPLNYINTADIISQIRLFAVGCQEFEKDITAEANFKY